VKLTGPPGRLGLVAHDRRETCARFVGEVDSTGPAVPSRPAAGPATGPGTPLAASLTRAQIERLKQTLCTWMTSLLSGPWDRSYFEARALLGAYLLWVAVLADDIHTPTPRQSALDRVPRR
jgi:hypothetical protein